MEMEEWMAWVESSIFGLESEIDLFGDLNEGRTSCMCMWCMTVDDGYARRYLVSSDKAEVWNWEGIRLGRRTKVLCSSSEIIVFKIAPTHTRYGCQKVLHPASSSHPC